MEVGGWGVVRIRRRRRGVFGWLHVGAVLVNEDVCVVGVDWVESVNDKLFRMGDGFEGAIARLGQGSCLSLQFRVDLEVRAIFAVECGVGIVCCCGR